MDRRTRFLMRKMMLLLILLGCFLVACSSSPTPTSTPSGEDGEAPNKTFWQLSDDSEFDVELTPWPPSGGKTSIEAVADLGDMGGDKPMVESAEYRVVDQPTSSAPYQKMTRTEKQVDDVTVYHFKASDVDLGKGHTVFIQFRCTGSSMKQPAELTDWSVKVP